MATLFLSDLHLPDEPSPLREGFLRFLAGPAREAESVYILGDLFEYWIGDDVGLRQHAAEVEGLWRLHQSGVRTYFMHGNRDFMIGRRFAAATGMDLLHDPHVIRLQGQLTLLSHGDLWCTDDVDYQRWRRFSRNPLAQWVFRRLPEHRRQAIAGGLRGKSHDDKQSKSEAIMDVNAKAIGDALARHQVRLIIHGHTHRPANHQVPVAEQMAERVVLADWRPQHMEYLKASAGELQRCVLN